MRSGDSETANNREQRVRAEDELQQHTRGSYSTDIDKAQAGVTEETAPSERHGETNNE